MRSRILIVEDEPINRNAAIKRLQNDWRTRSRTIKAMTEFWPHCPAEHAATVIGSMEMLDVVVLDLHLGASIVDGLSVIRSVRHFFTGVFVIHSNTYVNDADVRAEAKSLGVCLGTGKLADDLEDKVDAASWLHYVKSGLMLPFLGWMRKPVADCPCPDGLDWRTTMWECYQMGVNFDGSAESIDWTRAQQLEDQCKQIADAATRWYGQQSQEKRNGSPRFVESYPYTYHAYLMVRRVFAL